MSEEELDLIELEDEEGHVTLWEEVQDLFYNGEQYAILRRRGADSAPDAEVLCAARITPFTDEDGEEMEELVMVDDEKLTEKIIEIASLRFGGEEEEEV